MAKMIFILFLFSIQAHFVKPVSPMYRADGSYKYTLAGGLQSHLFSQCVEDLMSVKGSLYSITVSENEKYVRFEPEVIYEMPWIDVGLETSSNIFDCADAAFDLGALMFKHEPKCTITLNDTYNPLSKQSCIDTNLEVVYISSRVSEMNFLGDVFVGEEDFYGCLSRNDADDGWKYGREDGRDVKEDTLPRKDTCCLSAATDYCLVAECSNQPLSYCEAEARCLARGLQPASRNFHETVDTVDPTQLDTDEYYFWVNIYQEQDNIWKWQDDGSILENFFWCGGGPIRTTSNCAAIHFTNESHKIEYYRTDCTGTEVKCILCYSTSDSLTSCSRS